MGQGENDAAAAIIRREQEMPFGTQITGGGVRFRLWAPLVEKVALVLHGRDLDMVPQPRGWFELEVADARPGSRYGFRLPDGTVVPDPASRYQPDDVDGLSEVIDPLAFEWTDRGWPGRVWETCVFYEMHIGAFTPEGTFRAAIDKLDHLVDLGVTALQIMPLADFAGRWNWGYDGALLFAPDARYGRPEDLKALIDRAHALGLAVLLDVVYNHFGPKGHELPRYAPIHNDIATPWGFGPNLDGDNAAVVRDFLLANARHWLNEYRFDGLRFDALHALEDTGDRHFVQDLAELTRAATAGRHIHLVAENSRNQAGWLKRRPDGAPWLYTAQWNDDFHHTLHVLTTGEDYSYFRPYRDRIDMAARMLAEGFAWQGEWLEGEGRTQGEPSADLPPTSFVSFLQNHDHTGNRRAGERLHQLLPPDAVRALTVILLLSPQIPLLFMGEEWNAATPFPFFTDMPDLADAIRASRDEMLADYPPLADPLAFDPLAEATFRAAKLDWSEPATPEGRATVAFYRDLIALRAAAIVPRLAGIAGHAGQYEILGDRAFRVAWRLPEGAKLLLAANIGPAPQPASGWPDAAPLRLEGQLRPDGLGPWTAAVWLIEAENPRLDYG